VLKHFTWARAAEGTVSRYREAMTGSAPAAMSQSGQVTAAAEAVDVVSDRESRATC
jgi:hypothetical protein